MNTGNIKSKNLNKTEELTSSLPFSIFKPLITTYRNDENNQKQLTEITI